MRRALWPAAVLTLGACGGSPPAPAQSPVPSAVTTLTVTSDAFADGGPIPVAYTCVGQRQVPTIRWSGELRGATALAVIVDDPDAPRGTFVHRVVLDLPTSAVSLGADPPPGAHQATNSAGTLGWTPPCPPSGTHHYRFTVYGLSSPTGLADGVAATDAIGAIQSRAVVQGRLVGLVTH